MGNLFASPILHEKWYEIGNEYFEPLNQIQEEYMEEIQKLPHSDIISNTAVDLTSNDEQKKQDSMKNLQKKIIDVHTKASQSTLKYLLSKNNLEKWSIFIGYQSIILQILNALKTKDYNDKQIFEATFRLRGKYNDMLKQAILEMPNYCEKICTLNNLGKINNWEHIPEDCMEYIDFIDEDGVVVKRPECKKEFIKNKSGKLSGKSSGKSSDKSSNLTITELMTGVKETDLQQMVEKLNSVKLSQYQINYNQRIEQLYKNNDIERPNLLNQELIQSGYDELPENEVVEGREVFTEVKENHPLWLRFKILHSLLEEEKKLKRPIPIWVTSRYIYAVQNALLEADEDFYPELDPNSDDNMSWISYINSDKYPYLVKLDDKQQDLENFLSSKDEIFKKEPTKENIGERIQTRIEINKKMESFVNDTDKPRPKWIKFRKLQIAFLERLDHPTMGRESPMALVSINRGIRGRTGKDGIKLQRLKKEANDESEKLANIGSISGSLFGQRKNDEVPVSEEPIVATENPTVATENPTVATEQPTVAQVQDQIIEVPEQQSKVVPVQQSTQKSTQLGGNKNKHRNRIRVISQKKTHRAGRRLTSRKRRQIGGKRRNYHKNK